MLGTVPISCSATTANSSSAVLAATEEGSYLVPPLTREVSCMKGSELLELIDR